MVKKRIYRTALIGLGRIGFSLQFDVKREQPASHSSALKKNKRIQIVAGCDTDPEKNRKWKLHHPGAQVYLDHQTLLKNEKPDLCIIAVDEPNHIRVTLDAIKSKPLLIILEKPVAPNPEEAEKIRVKAEEYRVPILINHERRFSKDYLMVKTILDSGVIGDIQAVYGSLWSSMEVYQEGDEKDGNGSLIHDGTHLVDILHYLLGNQLACPSIDYVRQDDDHKIRSLHLHYSLHQEKGLTGPVYLDISGEKKYFGFEVEFKGKMGRIILGNGYFKVYERKESPYYTGFYSLVRNSRYKRPGKTGYFSRMVEHAISVLDGKEQLQSSLDDGIVTLQSIFDIIDAVKKYPGYSKKS